MRRRSDRLAAVCTVICLLCLVPIAFAVAPSVLGLSIRTDSAARAAGSAEHAAAAAAKAAAANGALIDRVNAEATIREQQFCELILGVHRDRVKRLKNTRAYLRHPLPSLADLNRYIKAISLPQLEAEVVKERRRLPPVCLHKP